MYKLIAHPPPDGVSPTPFYCYTIEDANGKEVGNCTKVTITIDVNKQVYPMMTFQRKWIEKNNRVMEETIEDVPVDIRVST